MENPANKRPSLWTRGFTLLCLAEFLGYAQHFCLQPTLPLYVTHLGGSPFIVGLVIAAFGITSVISRPIIGYWIDRWSDTGMMILGMIGQALSIFFCFMPLNGAVIFSNALRGIGWSSMAAAGYTLLASAAPQNGAARLPVILAAFSPARRLYFRPSRCGFSTRPPVAFKRFFSSPRFWSPSAPLPLGPCPRLRRGGLIRHTSAPRSHGGARSSMSWIATYSPPPR